MHGKAHANSAKAATVNTKRIKVDLTQQIVEAFDGAERVFRFECITGEQDHPTDRGMFTIWDMQHPYTSHTYHVPMNYALFFTRDRKALHQYHGPVFDVVRAFKKKVTDWFGSHGCVRLREDDAKMLFHWASRGTSVWVE